MLNRVNRRVNAINPAALLSINCNSFITQHIRTYTLCLDTLKLLDVVYLYHFL